MKLPVGMVVGWLLVRGGGWLMILGEEENIFTTNESANHFQLEVPLFYGQLKNNSGLVNHFSCLKHWQMGKIFFIEPITILSNP